jgi:perosamine synthetase
MNSIPVNTFSLEGHERQYLQDCIDSGWISSEGPFVEKFETQFAACVGRKYGIAVSSGSAALDVAVSALKIGPEDEVILSTFTIISCAAAIVRSGAMPVLVDCDPQTWNMDVRHIEAKITSKTKAIMVVHIYGLPVDLEPLLALVRKYKLLLIEDAAEMHGQTYNGVPCGSFGDVSIFSFYANKHITTGEGGMLVTDDSQLAERCRSLRNLCFEPNQRFVHRELGWNYRMTNLQAALGVAQLERLDKFVTRRRWIGAHYRELLVGQAGLQLPLPKTSYAENLYWVFGIVLEKVLDFDAKAFICRLAEHKIGARPFFWPMHEQPVFKDMGLFKDETYPVSENIARRGLYLPGGTGLTDMQIEYVAQVVSNVLENGCK